LPPMRPRVRNASKAAASSFTFGRLIAATVARSRRGLDMKKALLA
jgi:hypothetical protein